jgi:hypothetical protein
MLANACTRKWHPGTNHEYKPSSGRMYCWVTVGCCVQLPAHAPTFKDTHQTRVKSLWDFPLHHAIPQKICSSWQTSALLGKQAVYTVGHEPGGMSVWGSPQRSCQSSVEVLSEFLHGLTEAYKDSAHSRSCVSENFGAENRKFKC